MGTATGSDETGFEVNGRIYAPPAGRVVAVICIDGCADAYLNAALSRGAMPRLERALGNGGFRTLARAALPTFTNVNNACIVTGVPPAATGISGNFFLDPDTGAEVMMNSPEFLRCGTILAAAGAAGRKVAFVTAKDKLRTLLSKGLQGIAFSSEKVDEARRETHGIAHVEALVGRLKPDIYSAEASLYVLEAGLALAHAGMADFLYLSLTDYLQHKFGPEAPECLAFYRAIDREIGRLIDFGAVAAITADHGMNAKNRPDGSPNVIFLESELLAEFGTGLRVVCPITDPYVAHHGALGSFVSVHVNGVARLPAMVEWLRAREGVTEVYTREEAVRDLELPGDRIGDLSVLSGSDVVLGRTPADHDLRLLEGGLRSHGGRFEEMVPLIVTEALDASHPLLGGGEIRNFDVFDLACNATATKAGGA
ncbi:MAG TPA: phosphonoacetate hydrolase [Verrucomicrobiales bacterium]|nr:phosphonoacetate hydrolase [Verrucomicrobiales bacterium]